MSLNANSLIKAQQRSELKEITEVVLAQHKIENPKALQSFVTQLMAAQFGFDGEEASLQTVLSRCLGVLLEQLEIDENKMKKLKISLAQAFFQYLKKHGRSARVTRSPNFFGKPKRRSC